jgi:hypothetical protein
MNFFPFLTTLGLDGTPLKTECRAFLEKCAAYFKGTALGTEVWPLEEILIVHIRYHTTRASK